PRETLAQALALAGTHSTSPESAASLALAAANESVGSAGLEAGALRRSAGVVLGTCLGGARVAFDRIAAVPPGGERPEHPRVSADAYACASPAECVAGALGLSGPVLSVSTACASGTSAIALAADGIRRGE